MPSRPRQASRTSPLKSNSYSRLLHRESLRVVVLGPGEAQPLDLNKRRQIASSLRDRGYSCASLGEELLEDAEAPLHLALLAELPNIDLLLVLNSGPAPLAELATISSDLRARQITRVWSKREYAGGGRSTPRDVVNMFENWHFSEEEFESCELVASVIDTAERFCAARAQQEGRLKGWGLLPPP